MYTVILYIHILSFILFFLLLLFRLYFLFIGQDERLLLFSERTRALNLASISIIVITGVYLGFKYDFSQGVWFTLKLILLGIAVFVGDYAFKNFNRAAGWTLLAILLYVVALSFVKSPDLIPSHYP